MPIVILNVSASVAPLPISLQQTGALISQGATNLGAGGDATLTQDSDLTPLILAPLSLANLTWSGGTVLATTAAPIPGLSAGDNFVTTIAGATPVGYNGLIMATVTGASTFTFPLAVNPGAETIAGNYTPPGQGELNSMVSSFFDEGTNQSVQVLELGPGDSNTGPAALAAYIVANPNSIYSFLVPRSWDGSSGLLALLNSQIALTAKTYFFITTTVNTYQAYSNLLKSGFAAVEAPGIPLTEFSVAAMFQHSLSYAPSATNRMTPFSFSFLNGVTPYPQKGNNALFAALKAANISFVSTGAEGGISNAIIASGKMLDGNDFSYWFSVDWFQLNSAQAIANAIINGSNNPLAPLYYNQDGVNTLQDVVVNTTRNAITFGLANGTVARAALDGPVFSQNLENGVYEDQDVVNAIPFIIYTQENPSAYKQGLYGGLSAVYIPQRGFQQIIFSIQVTDFLSQ
jgi:hypothetical protein